MRVPLLSSGQLASRHNIHALDTAGTEERRTGHSCPEEVWEVDY